MKYTTKQIKVFRDWTTRLEEEVNKFCKDRKVTDIRLCHQDTQHCAIVVVYEVERYVDDCM
jgi:hypothetical protein